MSGHIAWLAVGNDPPAEGFLRQGWEDLFAAGFGAGWYWTEHWKTELDFLGTTTAETYFSRPIVVDGAQHFQSVLSSFERRTFGLGVQYQFFRNAWFHPYAGGGLLLTRERRANRFDPVVDFRSGSAPRVILEGFTDGPSAKWSGRAFVVTGFKAYVSERAFFRGDLRLGFLDGFKDSSLRAGFGIDF